MAQFSIYPEQHTADVLYAFMAAHNCASTAAG